MSGKNVGAELCLFASATTTDRIFIASTIAYLPGHQKIMTCSVCRKATAVARDRVFVALSGTLLSAGVHLKHGAPLMVLNQKEGGTGASVATEKMRGTSHTSTACLFLEQDGRR